MELYENYQIPFEICEVKDSENYAEKFNYNSLVGFLPVNPRLDEIQISSTSDVPTTVSNKTTKSKQYNTSHFINNSNIKNYQQ